MVFGNPEVLAQCNLPFAFFEAHSKAGSPRSVSDLPRDDRLEKITASLLTIIKGKGNPLRGQSRVRLAAYGVR